MALSLSSLLATVSAEEARDFLLRGLDAVGFPVTSWQKGGAARSLVDTFALGLADASKTFPQVAAGGLLELSSGPWLTLLAASTFQLTRKPATAATGRMVLTAAPGLAQTSLAPGQVIALGAGGLEYENTAALTLTGGTAAPAPFVARGTGTAYNAPLNTIRRLGVDIPGVSVLNAPDPSLGGAWLDAAGADEEDDASLRTRCRARWPQLGGGATALAYQGWALTASPEVRRVLVEGRNDFGTVRVRLAGAAGGVSAAAVRTVAGYLDQRRPLCVVVDVASAVEVVVSFGATLYVEAAHAAEAAAAATDAVRSYEEQVSFGRLVFRSAIVEALMSPAGVRNVETTAEDVVLPFGSVPVFAPALTVVAQ